MFDQKGRFLKQVGSKGTRKDQFNRPYSICFHESKLYIVDRNNFSVQILDGNSLKTKKSILVESRHGLNFIACSKKGNIILTTEENHVLILDEEGEIIKCFGTTGRDDGQFQYIQGVCINSLDQILIADRGNHRIQLFDQDGNFLNSFESENEEYMPCGIAVDKSNNMFVIDYECSRLVAYEPDGEYRCLDEVIDNKNEIRSDLIGVAILDNVIFVSNYSHNEIYIFNKNI